MQSSMFAAYEEEFVSLVNRVPNDISHAVTYESDFEKKKSGISKAETDIDQADQLLQQMAVESKGMSSADRRQADQKIRRYKETLSALKRDLSAAIRQGDRDELLGGSAEDGYRRMRDKKPEERMEMQNEKLNNSKRTLDQTNTVAIGIIDELHRNRETILSSTGKAQNVSGILGTARGVVQRMGRREFRNKVCAGFVLLVLFALGCYAIWALIIDTGSSGGGSSKPAASSGAA